MATLYADYEGWLRGDLRGLGRGSAAGATSSRPPGVDENMVRSLWARLQAREFNIIGKLAR
jgi:hypothetical protein